MKFRLQKERGSPNSVCLEIWDEVNNRWIKIIGFIGNGVIFRYRYVPMYFGFDLDEEGRIKINE